MRLIPRMALLAQGVCVVALTGMGYCHIKDVGMKFDEHVYYMAYLFSANIAASFALAGFAVACCLFRGGKGVRGALLGAGGLAPRTNGGLVWGPAARVSPMGD